MNNQSTEKYETVSFSERLKAEMLSKKLKQRVLASMLDVSPGSVFGWLNGVTPHRRTLATIATILGVDPEWLRTGEGNKEPKRPPPRPLEKLGYSLLPIADSGPLPLLKTLAERIAFLRKRKKLTLQQFGALCGVHKSYISRLEGGERINPTDYFLERCAMAFGVSVQWLKTGVATPVYEDPPYGAGELWTNPPLLPGELAAIGGFDPIVFPLHNMPVSFSELKTWAESFQEAHSRKSLLELLRWHRNYFCHEGPTYRMRIVDAVLLVDEILKRLGSEGPENPPSKGISHIHNPAEGDQRA